MGNLPFDIDSEGLAKQFETCKGLTPFPAKPCEGGMESSLDALELEATDRARCTGVGELAGWNDREELSLSLKLFHDHSL